MFKDGICKQVCRLKCIIALCTLHVAVCGLPLPSTVFDVRISHPVNGQNIPVDVPVPANVEIDALVADIDTKKYEICVTIKVITSHFPTRQCVEMGQSLKLNIETRTPGLTKFALWVQNSETKILASNVEEIALYAMNYTTGRESSINQTLLYHKCIASGSDKCAHHRYDRFYWKYLPVTKRDTRVHIGEVGLNDGASVRFWKSLYHNSSITVLETENTKLENLGLNDVDLSHVTVVHGDQSSVEDLNVMIDRAIENNIEGFDIFVDDGSHIPMHQKVTFDVMFKMVKPGGVYIIEDVETSFTDVEAGATLEYFALGSIKCVNREFHVETCPFDKNSTSHVESVTFAHNAIFFVKSSEEDEWLLNRPYRFGSKKSSTSSISMSYFNVTFFQKGVADPCDLNSPLSARYNDPIRIEQFIDAQLECAAMYQRGVAKSAILFSSKITRWINNLTHIVIIGSDDLSISLLMMKQMMKMNGPCVKCSCNDTMPKRLDFASNTITATQKLKLKQLASSLCISFAYHSINNILKSSVVRKGTFIYVNKENRQTLLNIIESQSKLTEKVMIIYGVEKYQIWKTIEKFLSSAKTTWTLERRYTKRSGLIILKYIGTKDMALTKSVPSTAEVTVCAAIIEPRNHKYLNHVILNMFENVAIARPIHVFHGLSTNFTDSIKNAVADGSIVLHQLTVRNFSARQYSTLITSKEFWLYFNTDKVLIFQTDSAVCYNGEDSDHFSLSYFLHYDYIGARHTFLEHGNGGLSLRDRRLSEKCSQFGGIQISWEDTYFSNCIKSHGGKMANFEEQQKFAVQYKLSSKSFGAHQVNLLEKSKVTRHDLETWRKTCPGYLKGMR